MKKYLKKYREKWNNKSAVSEILGTVLLLAIAVIIFSSLIVYVLSMDADPEAPNLHLVGTVAGDGSNAIIEHRGGDTLRLKDTKVMLQRGIQEHVTITFDSEGNASNEKGDNLGAIIKGGNNGDTDGLWEIGEYLSYDGFNENLQSWDVRAIVVDTVSNSIIMSGTINQGISDYLTPESVDFTWESTVQPKDKPQVDKDIQFMGEVIVDDDGKDIDGARFVTTWAWDFDNDGIADGYGRNPMYKYSSSGEKRVTLTVTYDLSVFDDDNPLPNSMPHNVKVYEGPTAIIAYEQESPGAPGKFDGIESYDPDGGTIESYEWTFGDGTNGSGHYQEHSYDATGTYLVTLTVTDDDGFTGYTEKTITWNLSGPADFPFADTNGNLAWDEGTDINVREYIEDDGVFYTWRSESDYVGNPDWSLVFPSAITTETNKGTINGFVYDGPLDLGADNTILIDCNISGVECLDLDATDVIFSDTQNTIITVGENGGTSDVLEIDATGDVYANNTHFNVFECGNLGTSADIIADGNVYLVDSNFTLYETGNGGVDLTVDAGGNLDATRLEVFVEKSSGHVECTFTFNADDDLAATAMNINSDAFAQGVLLSRNGTVDISDAVFDIDECIFMVKATNGAITAARTYINAGSHSSNPMLWAHTFLDFPNADITSTVDLLTLTSASGYIDGRGAKIAQTIATEPVNIWFGKSGLGSGDIILSSAEITSVSGHITIKTTSGSITATGIVIDSNLGPITIRNENGQIAASGATINNANQIIIKTTSGDITLMNSNINNEAGTITIRATTQGQMTVSNTTINNDGGLITIKTDQKAINARYLLIPNSDGNIEITANQGSIDLQNANLSTITSTDRTITIYSNEIVDCRDAIFNTKTSVNIQMDDYLYLDNAKIQVEQEG
ncbi:MAG: PKD domain-containing protein, partial [Thermoplasmatota archaeon]